MSSNAHEPVHLAPRPAHEVAVPPPRRAGALKEVLANPAVAARIQDTKAVREVRALEDFYKMMSRDPARAFYGPGGPPSAAAAVGHLRLPADDPSLAHPPSCQLLAMASPASHASAAVERDHLPTDLPHLGAHVQDTCSRRPRSGRSPCCC